MSSCSKPKEVELVLHCLSKMASKNQLVELARSRDLRCRESMSISALATLIAESGFDLETLREYFRLRHSNSSSGVLRQLMSSGCLIGHNWHETSPSVMHMRLQDRVRDCIDGAISFEQYMSMVADIAKEEMFIVARHDIVEEAIINHFPDVIPEIGVKSVTDFVFRGVPVDLKVSTHSDAWRVCAGRMTEDQKREFAIDYFKNADPDRMRKQAARAQYTWGLNRMYVMVKDESRWFSDLDALISEILGQMETAEAPFRISVNDMDMDCFVFEV